MNADNLKYYVFADKVSVQQKTVIIDKRNGKIHLLKQ